MKTQKYREWYYLAKENINTNFIAKILDNQYDDVKVLKADKRSFVKIIRVNEKKYVLKIPREKNTRKWQRFVNIFRGSDSFRNFKSMEKLEEMVIPSTVSVLALEKRTPFVVDSILVMELLEGKMPEKEDYPKILVALDDIHSKGYLHGDSQIQNFMVKDGKVYSIDLRLQRNIYGEIGQMYEFIYLRESAKDIDKYYSEIRNRISFKIAWIWKKWLYLHGDIRKVIKGKK